MTEFGFETTVKEVLEGVDLSGKLAVVTGGASGLGLETVRGLCGCGAKVVVPVRDPAKGEEAASSIRAAVPGADITMMPCDLASFESIRGFCDAFNAQHGRIDLLINNAGVMACPFATTADGFEMQFGVCHLGHFLLTNLLMPAVLRGAPARIVNLSSRGHHFGPVNLADPNFAETPYEKWDAYGRAKTANILFTVELERRFSDKGVHAYAVHPGAIATALGRHLSEQDIKDMVARATSRSEEGFRMKSPEQGAATTVYAATSPALEGQGGIYLEDCHVSEINDDPNAASGVRSYALDADTARKLWAASEKWTGLAG
ncbi:SDR family NAD(P)-dependent oxidoreductase [Pyruvatibacter mobilis]|uniref:SDR family NAD(P)-dependent oxidoreductase n=1 Tax=Pyruvatibacter mobilis TaxID=1712261 RepID=UPI003BAAAC75